MRKQKLLQKRGGIEESTREGFFFSFYCLSLSSFILCIFVCFVYFSISEIWLLCSVQRARMGRRGRKKAGFMICLPGGWIILWERAHPGVCVCVCVMVRACVLVCVIIFPQLFHGGKRLSYNWPDNGSNCWLLLFFIIVLLPGFTRVFLFFLFIWIFVIVQRLCCVFFFLSSKTLNLLCTCSLWTPLTDMCFFPSSWHSSLFLYFWAGAIMAPSCGSKVELHLFSYVGAVIQTPLTPQQQASEVSLAFSLRV